MVFHIVDNNPQPKGAVIKVIGVGGGGGNALNYMLENSINGVDFICANTDLQALKNSKADKTIQLGSHLTNGLGAGADPEVGREAALEVSDRISEELSGADMVFITAGLGGGTGTGSAPVIAEIARNMGILTIAVVTKPFDFERKMRMTIAEQGIENLSKYVDSLITIPNEKLSTVLGEDVTMVESFAKANDVLYGAVQGIAELVTCDGLINLDFADVKQVMSQTGMAMIGSGCASGDQRAFEAAQKAINNPLLDDVDLHNVNGLLINVTASSQIKMKEYKEIASCITERSTDSADIMVGVVLDEDMGDDLRVTMVATGLNAGELQSMEVPDSEVGSTAQAQTHGMWQESQQESTAMPNDMSLLNTTGESSKGEGASQPTNHNESQDTGQGDKSDKEYEDYLDIPTFLRQQVD